MATRNAVKGWDYDPSEPIRLIAYDHSEFVEWQSDEVVDVEEIRYRLQQASTSEDFINYPHPL
jgi:hypothetical protein